MQAWWDALDVLGKIFALIAIPSTLILVVQTILMFLGLGGDGGADAVGEDIPSEMPDTDVPGGIFGDDVPRGTDIDGDISEEPGLKILSFRTIVAFLAVFGWVGIELLKLGAGSAIAITVGIAAGIIIMVVMALLIRELFKLQSNGNVDMRNAVGASGTAYIPIPAQRSGKGKVTVTFQNTSCECDAVTDEKEDIPSYSEVLVIGISGKDTLVVKKK